MQTLEEYIKRNRREYVPQTELVQNFGELYTNTRAIYYDVPTENGVYKVFAFLSVPKTRMPKGGYPAVVLMHGGNGAAYCEITKAWADKGFVAIAPDFNGKCGESLGRRDIENPLGGPCGYGFSGISETHPWAYFGTLSAMRAVDVLRARTDVNSNKICTCGLSWGGFLNLLVLSQDKRIAAGSIIYSSAYTHESEWGKKQLELLPDEERNDYIRYIEPCNYLHEIQAPVLFTAGTQDGCFKMDNRRKTANSISGKAYFALRKVFGHGNFSGFEQSESAEFFHRLLSKKRIPQPRLRRLSGEKFSVRAFSESDRLRLLFTKDDVVATEIQKWRELSVSDGQTICLPKRTTAVLLVEENGNCVWSSGMYSMKEIDYEQKR